MLASGVQPTWSVSLTKMEEACIVDAFLSKALEAIEKIVLVFLCACGAFHTVCWMCSSILKDLKSLRESYNRFVNPRRPS
jgi:hypothetical protein